MDNVTRLFDLPKYQLENHPLEKALVTKYNGQWKAISTKEYLESCNALSRKLLQIGVKKDDKIVIISSSNRTEWHIADMGILQVGAQAVPIYPTISTNDFEYILKHCEAKYAFVSDAELYNRLLFIVKKLPYFEGIFSFDKIEGLTSIQELIEQGRFLNNKHEVEEIKKEVKKDDLATIIYTSGTTGKPKGVMLSHDNIISNFKGCQDRLPIKSGDICLSFLPVCHIFERMLTYLYQYNSISIYFAESIDKMGDNLKEVQPQLITVVPRLIEKVYDKIYTRGSELSGIRKNLFFWAIKLGYKYEPYGANGWWYRFQLSIARRLVFSKWHDALGGKLKVMISGSAPLQPRLARIFCAAGLPIMEGYGLTETSPVISVNRKKGRYLKIGTVGKPIVNVEVKIAEDGEILCKGPNVMLGYYKNPEQTKEVMTDGYLHTGDIGEIDEDGFLKITDRKKQIFKTSGGKYIIPQIIENELKQSRFIEQVLVVGEGQKMPGAIIQPNFEFVKEWARRHDLQLGYDWKENLKNKQLRERLSDEVRKVNRKLGKWEQIKVFEFTPDEWTIDAGHLTPTLKPKRKNVIEIYKDIYNDFYDIKE